MMWAARPFQWLLMLQLGPAFDASGEDFAAGVAGAEAEDVELVVLGERGEEVDESGVDDAGFEVAFGCGGEVDVRVIGQGLGVGCGDAGGGLVEGGPV